MKKESWVGPWGAVVQLLNDRLDVLNVQKQFADYLKVCPKLCRSKPSHIPAVDKSLSLSTSKVK